MSFVQDVKTKMEKDPSLGKTKLSEKQIWDKLGTEISAYKAKNYPDDPNIKVNKGVLRPPPPLVKTTPKTPYEAILNNVKENSAIAQEHAAEVQSSKTQGFMETVQRDNASFLDVAKASAIAWGNANPMVKSLGHLFDDNYENTREDGFVASNSADAVMADLQSRKIADSMENIDYLLRAKNMDNYNWRIANILKNDELNTFATQTLTSPMLSITSVTGAISDPTAFAFAPAAVFNRLRGGAKLASMVGGNAGLQYTLSKGRDYGDPTRGSIDTYLDVGFGALFDGALSYRAAKKAEQALTGSTLHTSPESAGAVDDIVNGHSRSVDAKNALDLTPAQKYDFQKGYTFKEAPFVKKVDEVPTTPKGVSHFEKYINAIDNIREIGSMGKGALKTYTTARDAMRTTVSDLTERIRTAPASEKDALVSQLDDIRAIAKSYKLDVLDKKMGYTSKADKIVMDKTNKATFFKRGEVTYETNISKIKNAVKSKVADSKTMLKELKDIENLKPSTLVENGLTLVKAKRLRSIGRKLDELKGKTKRLPKHRIEEQALRREADDILTEAKINQGKGLDSSQKSLLRQKELYERIASVLDEITFNAQKSFDDLTLDYFPTQKQRDVFAKEIGDVISEAAGTKMKVKFDGDRLVIDKEINLKVDSDGNVNFFGKKLSLAVLLAVAGPSLALADSGGEDTVWSVIMRNLPAIIFLGLIGAYTHGQIKKYGSYPKTIGNFSNRIKSTELIGSILTEPKNVKLEEVRASVSEGMNTGIINSYQWVMDKANANTKALMEVLGYDAVNPNKTIPALRRKYQLYNKDELELHEAMDTNYGKWLEETGQKETTAEKILAYGEGADLERVFAEDVSYFREFGDDGRNFPKSVRDMANVADNIFGRNLDLLQKNNITGFSNKTIDANRKTYVPHTPIYDSFKRVVDLGGKEQLTEKIAAGIAKQQGKAVDEVIELAEELVNAYSKVRHFGKTSSTDIDPLLNAMRKVGIDVGDISGEELASIVRGNSNAISRGKFRIDIDLREIGDIKLEDEYGNPVTFNMNNLYDRRIDSLITGYSAQASGAVAVKEMTRGVKINGQTIEKGIEGEIGLRQIIANEPDPRAYKIMDGLINNLYGHRNYDPEDAMHTTVTVLKNLTNVDLIYSFLSAGGELATATKHAFFGGSKTARKRYLDGIENIIKGMVRSESAPQTKLMRKLVDFYGTGSAMGRRDYTVRTADAVNGMDDFAGGGYIKGGSQYLRTIALKLSQNMRADDFMKQISMLYHTERLGKLAHPDNFEIKIGANGEKKVTFKNYSVSDSYMRRVGITPEFIENISNKITLSKEGDLMDEFDPDSLEEGLRNELQNIGYRMIQIDSPEEVLTSTPIEKHTSSAGRLLGVFSGFALQSYLGKGVSAVRYGDADSLMETVIYMGGLYAGLYAKEAIKGKDINQEDMMYNTLMMMPLMAPIGAYTMGTDPVALGIMNQMFRQTTNLATSAYPEDNNGY